MIVLIISLILIVAIGVYLWNEGDKLECDGISSNYGGRYSCCEDCHKLNISYFKYDGSGVVMNVGVNLIMMSNRFGED